MVGIDLVPDEREQIHLTMEFLERGFCTQALGIDFEFDHDSVLAVKADEPRAKNTRSTAGALIEAGDDALGLTLDGFFLERFTLVTVGLAFAHTDFHLDVGVLPVGAQDG